MSEASSGQKVTDSINGKLTFEQDKNRIVGRDENNKARLLISASGDDFSMKIAKDGFDAITDGNDDLIFNSNQNVLKIVSSGTANATIPNPMASGSRVTVTIPHGLGVKPAFQVYIQIPAGDGTMVGHNQLTNVPAMLINTNISDVGGAIVILAQASVDTTNLYLEVVNVSGSSIADLGTPWTFRYYILQETAS